MARAISLVFLLLIAAVVVVAAHRDLRTLHRALRARGADIVVQRVEAELAGVGKAEGAAGDVPAAPAGGPLSTVTCNGMVGFEIETGRVTTKILEANKKVFQRDRDKLHEKQVDDDLYSTDVFHSKDVVSVKNYFDEAKKSIPLFTFSTDQCSHEDPYCAAAEFVYGPQLLDNGVNWLKPFAVMYTLAMKSGFIGSALATVRKLNKGGIGEFMGTAFTMEMEAGEGWCPNLKDAEGKVVGGFEPWTQEELGAFTLSKGSGTSGGVQVNYGAPIDNLGYDRATLKQFGIQSLCTLYGTESTNACALLDAGRALGDRITTNDQAVKHQLRAFFAQMALMGASYDTKESQNANDPSANAGSIKDHAVQLIKTGMDRVYEQYLTDATRTALKAVSKGDQTTICQELVKNVKLHKFTAVATLSRTLVDDCKAAFSEDGMTESLSATGKPIDVTRGAKNAECPMIVVESRLKDNNLNKQFAPVFTQLTSDSWKDAVVKMRAGARMLNAVIQTGLKRN